MVSYQASIVDDSVLEEMASLDFRLQNGMRFHLVGIGGAGMSAIAHVLLGRGYAVSGSDQQLNALTADLEKEGAIIFEGHLAEQIAGADVLVISSAVPEGNPEVAAARKAGIPVLKRADLIGHLMADQIGIAIAGSHGKTTTTGMIAQILLHAGLDPTIIVGGVVPSLGANGRYGGGDYFVVEADEYDYMFLGLRPEVIIITNLEHDHPDIYPTKADYTDAFRHFISLLPVNGRLVACVDDPGTAELVAGLNLPGVEISTYGISEENDQLDVDFQALDCRPNQLGGTDFLVGVEDQIVGLARLRVPGIHNVRNALAAIIIGLDLNIEFDIIRQALAEFGGVGRRFQVIGEVGGVTIIDDYAHHPTEIQATLLAAKQRYPGRRLWAVWQPHTFSRTKLYVDEFAASFSEADRVIALDIYPSRETDTLGISTADVLERMVHPQAVHIPKRHEAAAHILDRVRPGDVILTLGAGDGDMVGQWVMEGLKKRMGS